jgi:hypothetical protein
MIAFIINIPDQFIMIIIIIRKQTASYSEWIGKVMIYWIFVLKFVGPIHGGITRYPYESFHDFPYYHLMNADRSHDALHSGS